MAITGTEQTQAATTQRWTLDRSRTTVEFEVKHLWGLDRVVGRFDRFDGACVFASHGSTIELTIDAASVETGNAVRDRDLRSARFFDVVEHPQVRFTSSRVADNGDGSVRVSGELEAAGTTLPLAFDAVVRELDDELEIEATTAVDQRRFGMTRGPLWSVRPPAKLHVKARLVPERPDGPQYFGALLRRLGGRDEARAE